MTTSPLSGDPLSGSSPSRGMDPIQRIVARRRRQDLAFNALGIGCTLVGLVVLVTLLSDLAVDGLSRIDGQFLSSFPSRFAAKAGVLPALVGTLLIMLVTALAAVPLGIAAGVYLEEYAPKNRVTSIIEINIANLAGVPSIIYGLMALGLFVYALGFGHSILTGGMTLAVLILPIVIVATRESLRAVPGSIREAAYAMGATKWQVTWHHLLPCSAAGIATGVIIGLSRAIGETAPLTTIGVLTFITYLPPSPFHGEAPYVSFDWVRHEFTVLPIQMYDWVSRPQRDFHANAAAAGIILVAVTLAFNSVAVALRYRMRKRVKW